MLRASRWRTNVRRDRMKLVSWIGLIAAVLIGCGSDSQSRSNFSTIQSEIFSPKCATSGCHLGAAASAKQGAGIQTGLDLTAGQAYGALVNVDSGWVAGAKRVVPGDRNASVLFEAVNSPNGNNTPSGRMPAAAQPLSQADINAIGVWIDDGAQNN